MKRLLCTVLFLALSVLARAATPAEQELIDLQQRIDDAVAGGDRAFLQGAYADDFRFKHGTGLVDNKESWLKSVEKNQGNFLSRAHSDVEAEIHGDVGIVAGKLKVVRKDNHGYLLDYVRAFVRRDGHWQMIMHRTVVQQNF
jgi:hypothetical protein